jgi:hypothetical protein
MKQQPFSIYCEKFRLRKFALEHAEDKEAFSEPYALSRKK